MRPNMASTEEVNPSPSQDLKNISPPRPEGPNVQGCNPERGKISANQDGTSNCSLERRRESRSRVEIILICVLLLLFFLLLGAVGWGTYYMTSCEKCEKCDSNELTITSQKSLAQNEPRELVFTTPYFLRSAHEHRSCWCDNILKPYCPTEPFSYAGKCVKGCEENTTYTCGDYIRPDTGCPHDWEPMGNSCYKHFPQEKTYQQAQDVCNESHHGGLPEPRDALHNAQLIRYASSVNSNNIWLGAVNERWQSDNSSLKWTSWANYYVGTHPCIEVYLTAPRSDINRNKWRGRRCSDRNQFVCQTARAKGQENPTVFQPCGVNFFEHKPEFLPFPDAIDLTLTHLSQFGEQLKKGVEDMKRENIFHKDDYSKDLMWRPISGLPVPMTKARNLTKENVLSALKEDHLDIQKYLLFLDVLEAEEMAGNIGSDIIISNLLLSKILGFQCLCRFDILIRLKNSTANRFVTHENLDDDMIGYVQRGSNERWLLANMTLTQAHSWAANITQDYRKFSENSFATFRQGPNSES